MCGISGFINFGIYDLRLKDLEKINHTLAHRGPDDEGYVVFQNQQQHIIGGKDTNPLVYQNTSPYTPQVNFRYDDEVKIGLGHRRLSILDLSPLGHQPMCDPGQKYWLVYNGELYNFKILRKQLQEKGYSFMSETDTEVLLAAYQEWGEDCVHRFEGMWAFALYDSTKDTLFCSRDRFGVKPFYYILDEGKFIFASEIKALLQSKGFQKEINTTAAFEYLALAKLELGEESLFKGIFELKAGHQISIHIPSQKINKTQYYALNFNPKFGRYHTSQSENYQQKIKELLERSLQERWVADVPIANCLSGGIDSSILVSLGKQFMPDQQQTCFTASFPNHSIDETKWAKLVNQHCKTDAHYITPNAQDFKKDLEAIVYGHDIPFLSASTYVQYTVMKAIAEKGFKVSIDGQGADELFSGYGPHYSAYMYQAIKSGHWTKVFENWPEADNTFTDYYLLGSFPIKNILGKLFPSYFNKKALRNSHKEFSYIQASFWKQHEEKCQVITQAFQSNLNQLLAYEFKGDGLKNLLRTGDRNSMAHGIEARVPFSDSLDLIEYVFQIPSSYKIKDHWSKYLLRKTFLGQVPKAIMNRKDKGSFAAPEDVWLPEMKDTLLDYIPEKSDEFVDWKAVRRDWDSLLSPSNLQQRNARLWRLINFAVWRRVYGV